MRHRLLLPSRGRWLSLEFLLQMKTPLTSSQGALGTLCATACMESCAHGLAQRSLAGYLDFACPADGAGAMRCGSGVLAAGLQPTSSPLSDHLAGFTTRIALSQKPQTHMHTHVQFQQMTNTRRSASHPCSCRSTITLNEICSVRHRQCVDPQWPRVACHATMSLIICTPLDTAWCCTETCGHPWSCGGRSTAT